jgi:MoaA/NifB/PqqE/SkfB family radical SAM enzyme
MMATQWTRAFKILEDLGVEFNLILGNEPWLFGPFLLDILRSNKVPYAMYTTAPEHLFNRYRDLLFSNGLDNLSCGIDYPYIDGLDVDDDSFRKSRSAYEAFVWTKQHYPNVDIQGTITIHKKNIDYVPLLVQQLIDLEVFYGVNFINWNADGAFDFFPERQYIDDLTFKPEDTAQVQMVLDTILNKPGSRMQSPEVITQIRDNPELLQMKWHCGGDPYGGPTIDADGTLRCCGYRKGRFTPTMTIFDLPGHEDHWEEMVYQDAMECPGCCWMHPMQVKYWRERDPEMGKKVLVKHAGRHIDEKDWSKRNIE